MNDRRSLALLHLAILLSLLFTTLPAGAAQVTDTSKIEPALLDQLSMSPSTDLVVRFAGQADLSAAYTMNWADRGEFVYSALKQAADRAQRSARSYLDRWGLRYESYVAGNELYVWAGDLEAATALAALSEVEQLLTPPTYYLDPIIAEAPAPQATVDWGIVDTKADQFWATFGFKGEGIVVANIDTGVQWNHPALVNQYKCNPDPADPSCWLDPASVCGGNMCDNNGHGTHTMGTMVAKDDPALPYIAGMAPNARWIACKGCESSSCSYSALSACGDWVLAPNGDPANRPNVVNNSWGGSGGNDWYQDKVVAWRAAGIFPAFSGGNAGPSCSTLGSPGDYQESFASAAHDSSRNVAYFSSRGPSFAGHDPYTKPNISAPGVNVCSTVPTNSWNCTYSGTSMASPHTAGAVALLWSCNLGLVGQIDQTFQILQDNADPPPGGDCGAPPDGEGNYAYGYGYLDVLAAGVLNCGQVGYLQGHVVDSVTHAPIQGATVQATRDGTGPTTTTDADGYYTVTLGVGTYDVAGSHLRYVTAAVSNIVVLTDTVTTQDLQLQPRGRLLGHVVDYDNGFPLAAAVTDEGGFHAHTNLDTGYYELYLDPGTHAVIATAMDYLSETVVVTLTSGQDTLQDLTLQALIAFNPSPLHVTLPWQATETRTVTLTNRMATAYPFIFREKSGGFQPILQEEPPATPGSASMPPVAPAGEPAVGPADEPSSAGPAPYISAPTGEPAVEPWAKTLANPAYGYDLVQATLFRMPDMGAPGTWDVVAQWEPFFAGGDFMPGDYFSHQYAISFGGNEFVRVNTANGTRTLITTVAPPDGGVWTGMTISPGGVIYLSSTICNTFSHLYTIDPTTGALTAIGRVPNAACLIDIAYNPADQMIYGVEIIGDVLMRINPANGQSTTIGLIGFNANYAQDLDFDDTTGVLYYAAYNSLQSRGELRTVNLQTGATTLIGPFPDNTQVDGFAVQAGGEQEVPWLGETPPTGSVPAHSSLYPTLSFTATSAGGVYQPGDYYCDVKLQAVPAVSVRVTMTVLPGDNMGRVEGYVTDNCTGAPLEATVLIGGGDPITQTWSDKDTGHYRAWLAEGSYLFTFRLAGYVDYTATVEIIRGQQLTLDAPMAPQRPCVAVDPGAMDLWVMTGTQEVHPLNIANRGGLPLDFELHEVSGTAHISPRVLILYSDDSVEPIYSQLLALGGFAALDTFSVYNATPTLAQLLPYDVVVTWRRYPYSNPTGLGNVLADYVDAGGRVIATLFSLTPGELAGRFGTQNYLPMKGIGRTNYGSCLGTFDPYHPIMAGVTAACDQYRLLGSYLTANSYDVARWQLDNEIMVAAKNDRSVVAIAGYLGPISSRSGQEDLILWNTIMWQAIPHNSDVPWLSEEPLTATLSSRTDMDVAVTVTAFPTMSLGTYTATLLVENNDRVAGDQDVEVIMHIFDQFITPTAGFESNTPVCLGTETILTNTTVPGIPPQTNYRWDFGDQITSTLPNPRHTYLAGGTYTISLAACNEAPIPQCDTYVAPVEVLSLPVAGFTYTVDQLTVTLTNSSQNATSYLWDMGDGTTSTETNPVHAYAVGGRYTVTLAALGCNVDYQSFSITVGGDLTPGFTSSSPVCLGEEVVFTNTTTGTLPIDYQWTFGDGITSTLPNPIHLYGAAGSYTVTLLAENSFGTGLVTGTVQVQPGPAASFTYLSGGLVVTFTNTSQRATAYEWDFGDGSGSQLPSPVHTYSAEGSYTVVLTATGECGEDVYTTTVLVSLAPVAGFTSNTPVCLGQEMVFTNTSAGSPPLSYRWEFGDGVTSTLRNPVHVYGTTGSYPVTLTVQNPRGTSTATDLVAVTPLPIAGFTYIADRLAITFTNTSTHTASYLWDMGDGITSTLRDPVHTYAAAGTYTVTLQATGECGSATATQVLQVTLCAQAQIITVTTQVDACAVTLTPQVRGDSPFEYLWDFGAAGTSTETNPTVDLGVTGAYPVTLDVWNCDGIGHAVMAWTVEVDCSTVYQVYLPLVHKHDSP